MKRRADAQEATRLRITESAVELHRTLGPSQTTMAAVAQRAGVQRSTLYRHFPDEAALFDSCRAHWYASHPPPDLDRWREVAATQERLVAALTELYAWYRSTGTMLDVLIRDETLSPPSVSSSAHSTLASTRRTTSCSPGVASVAVAERASARRFGSH